jgi:hypothetical protein
MMALEMVVLGVAMVRRYERMARLERDLRYVSGVSGSLRDTSFVGFKFLNEKR